MDELIRLVAQNPGLPADKARVAFETVINFIKMKLPPNFAGQVDAILSGGNLSDNPLEGLGGLLGKKK